MPPVRNRILLIGGVAVVGLLALLGIFVLGDSDDEGDTLRAAEEVISETIPGTTAAEPATPPTTAAATTTTTAAATTTTAAPTARATWGLGKKLDSDYRAGPF